MMKLQVTVIFVALAAFLVLSSVYIVDEREQVVITQFGKPVGEAKKEPNLYFKIPFIQQANVFPKNLLEWDGDPGQIPTKDKTYLWVDTFARWRIIDPLKYFQTVNNERNAQARLDDIIDPAVRNFVTSHPLIETVRKTNRKLDTFEAGVEDEDKENQPKSHLGNVLVGREKIAQGILEQAKPKLFDFGIELVDVQIKRINYVENVRKSVYGRMIAERKQIAEKFRSEGMGEAQKIEGEREKMLKEITSEAYRKAQEVMGKADATAADIYATAYSKDPEFYSFVKTLEIYSQAIDENSSLVISTDSDFFKYVKGYK